MPEASFKIDGDMLVIKLPLNKEGKPSKKTGKTRVVATTSGNKATGCKLPNGKEIIVGCNAYYKPDPE